MRGHRLAAEGMAQHFPNGPKGEEKKRKRGKMTKKKLRSAFPCRKKKNFSLSKKGKKKKEKKKKKKGGGGKEKGKGDWN